MGILCKILPWKKNYPKVPNYSIDQKDENVYFTLLEGKYKNIVVTYSNIQFLEDLGFAKLKFNFNIIESPFFLEEVLQNDDEFVTILGDVLQNYILEKAKKIETNRSRDFEEPDFQ
jgi:hypothetical protein